MKSHWKFYHNITINTFNHFFHTYEANEANYMTLEKLGCSWWENTLSEKKVQYSKEQKGKGTNMHF